MIAFEPYDQRARKIANDVHMASNHASKHVQTASEVVGK
jgi:hypothetical protein